MKGVAEEAAPEGGRATEAGTETQYMAAPDAETRNLAGELSEGAKRKTGVRATLKPISNGWVRCPSSFSE